MVKKRLATGVLVAIAVLLLTPFAWLGLACGKKEVTNCRILFQSFRGAPQSDPDFQSNFYKYSELYTMKADGSDVRRITNNSYYENQADVSPDGKKILCSLHFSPTGSMEETDPGWEIAVMDINGSNLTNLTNNNYLDFGAHWNHDGTKIVYLSDTAHRTREQLSPEEYVPIQLDVYTMDPDGSNNAQLTAAKPSEAFADPSFSFNNPSKILYVHDANLSDGTNWDMSMMDADGQNRRLILKHSEDMTAINDPMFSPDGQTIVFEAEKGKDEYEHVIYHMFTVDSSGENLKQITEGDQGESEGMAQFSPDGSHIIFDQVIWSSSNAGTRKLWIAKADGSSGQCISGYLQESCGTWIPG